MIERIRTLLRTRLAARSAAETLFVVSILGLISFATAGYITERRVNEQEYRRMEELLDTVEQTVQIACFLNNQELATEVAGGLMKNRVVHGVAIQQDGGALVQLSKNENARSANSSDALLRQVNSPFDADVRVCEISLTPDQKELRAAVTQASTFNILLLAFQLIGIGLVITAVTIRHVTRPISRVSRRLNELEAETGEKLTVPKGNEEDEIGRLVLSVNSMIDHLVKVIGTERQLRVEREVAERRFRTIFENVETGIFELSIDGRITVANPAFSRMFGLTLDCDFNEQAVFLQNLADEAEIDRVLQAVVQSWSHQHLEVSVKVNEHPRWISILLNQIEEGRLQCVANDITERRLAAETAKKMAITDQLTGLGNRRGFDWRLESALRAYEADPEFRCALIVLDLDNFKAANDTYGHGVGDLVLQEVGKLLDGLIRKADFAARLGGDEFVVLLDNTSEREHIVGIAERFLEQLSEPMVFDGEVSVQVGASLGIAILGKDANTAQQLIRLADAAMYESKHAGRNTYRFHGD